MTNMLQGDRGGETQQYYSPGVFTALFCNSPMVLLFLQAYFFDAPEVDHLPTTAVVPNQTVVAAKSS